LRESWIRYLRLTPRSLRRGLDSLEVLMEQRGALVALEHSIGDLGLAGILSSSGAGLWTLVFVSERYFLQAARSTASSSSI
jgi:hypothetical protein